MRPAHQLTALGLIAVLLAGCFGESPTSTPGDATSSPAASAGEPSEPAAASADPEPSDDLGPFSCDLPIHEDATVPRANIVDVRIGRHTGFDRVVFEFGDGLPEMTLNRDEPPFAQDGSGFPIQVDGSSFLRLTMRGGTKQMDDGSSSYSGATEFEAGFPTLVHLVEGGDFEALSTWYIGLSSEACVRVLQLTDDGAPRLVIDIEH
jgi:hypothetical protein